MKADDCKTTTGEAYPPAPCSAILIAFVQGAAWWEYHQTKATMWQSDRRMAEEEAMRREENGTLGVLPNTKRLRTDDPPRGGSTQDALVGGDS